MSSKFIKILSMIVNHDVISFSPIWDRANYRRSDDPGFDLGSDSDSKLGWLNRLPKLPVSVSLIILMICLIVFMLSLVNSCLVINYLALIPALLPERPWTIVTYMFVHVTFDHLFWNMLFLFFFGIELERRLGERRFLGLYLISGVVAALAQILLFGGGILLGADQRFLTEDHFFINNLLPTGIMREPFSSVKRADGVIINRKFMEKMQIPDNRKKYFEGKKIFTG